MCIGFSHHMFGYRIIIYSRENEGYIQVREDRLWQAVIGEIELGVSRGNYVTWFKNTKLLRLKDGVATIGVANVFIKQQHEIRYADLIISTLAKNGVNVDKIEYKIHSSAATKPEEEEPLDLNNDAPADVFNKPVKKNSSSGTPRLGLNEKYTFENFIVGSGNELAYAACQAIAASPGSKYNPLFLYGGVGIGKTHLIQAVGNEIAKRNKSASVVYVSTEQFVKEFIDAVRYKKNTDFAGHYRSVDVLIVDDIQFIAGKDKTQEEFFHTFNALHQSNKQIIISSDKPPKDIPTLEDRLKSRFAWGMSIDMQNPDFETRCAIVQSKAEAVGISLSIDIVEYLAKHIQTNIRELEGALNQLIAFCEMSNVEPDIEIVTRLIDSNKTRPKHISAKQVVEKVAKYFHVSMEDILGPKRDKDIVVPRQIAMYVLRSELHLSFPKIAKELGRKDHTTALHSVEKIDKSLISDSLLQQNLKDIREKLYA